MTTYVVHLDTVRSGGVRTALKALSGRLVGWQRRRQAIAELRALPPYLLTDIGINAGDIPAAVDGLLARR